MGNVHGSILGDSIVLKPMLLKCLFYLQVHRLLRFLNRRKVVILMYHGFTERARQDGVENHQGKHLKIDKFRAQLDYLTRNYSILSLDELVQHHRGRTTPPANSVVITIDDGYESTYTLAFALLSRYRVTATVFLTTDFVDKKMPLWVDKIECAITLTRASNLSMNLDNKQYS